MLMSRSLIFSVSVMQLAGDAKYSLLWFLFFYVLALMSMLLHLLYILIYLVKFW